MALPPAAYCRHCHWLIPTDHLGRLERHTPPDLAYRISQGLSVSTTRCPGSYEVVLPGTPAPTEVPSLAFADEPPTVVCTVCGETVIERYRDPGYPIPHGPRGAQGTYCRGSWVSSLYSDSAAPAL